VVQTSRISEETKREAHNLMEIIQGAMEYQDIEYCIADGGEKERERERARDIYLSTPWETIPMWDVT
jgi:hypothetical protein